MVACYDNVTPHIKNGTNGVDKIQRERDQQENAEAKGKGKPNAKTGKDKRHNVLPPQ
jgi:hypothetical protein